MPAPMKKPRTDKELVTLRLKVHPANVERIKRFVAAVEPAANGADGITADQFYAKHFTGQPEWAVALRGYRYREDLTQAQLAELTGIPQRHISEMENGRRPIGKERARKLAAVLNADYRLFL
ncbi:helix-turn-helix domain-containing protein [Desulfurivibrio sp. C05AmB]|jgi:DNA-binding XRE family transcriptional regulator|uniref:helix-turn-helix domain-containing protein n=1 Tax=Desulfurivibrio sp. C05AmB TaxID=3374371 RepID=UPI00376ECCEE